MTPRSWPQRPAARTEQRALPLPGTLAGKYAAWRKTPDGELLFRRFEGAVLLALKDRPARLSGKFIWEQLRAKYHHSADNSFATFAVYELEDLFPCLVGLFKHKKQTAA